MGKDTKLVAHEGTDSGTSIFYKHEYGEGHCDTLLIGYPLPTLSLLKLDPIKIYYLELTKENLWSSKWEITQDAKVQKIVNHITNRINEYFFVKKKKELTNIWST